MHPVPLGGAIQTKSNVSRGCGLNVECTVEHMRFFPWIPGKFLDGPAFCDDVMAVYTPVIKKLSKTWLEEMRTVKQNNAIHKL